MTSQRTRARMVERLRDRASATSACSPRMAAVPRHLFVEEALASRAYEDTALPIGFGQTISQPYVVARMIELLLDNGKPREGARGRHRLRLPGGGAWRSIFPEVYSVERIKAPARARARQPARRCGSKNLRLAHGDGYAGLEKAAPFQAIVVAAAPPRGAARRCYASSRPVAE